jgi:hypothetical protein
MIMKFGARVDGVGVSTEEQLFDTAREAWRWLHGQRVAHVSDALGDPSEDYAAVNLSIWLADYEAIDLSSGVVHAFTPRHPDSSIAFGAHGDPMIAYAVIAYSDELLAAVGGA